MRIGVISERPWASDVRLGKLLDELKSCGHSLFVLSGGGNLASEGVSADGIAYSVRPIAAGFSKVWTLEFLRETYLSPDSLWAAEVEGFIGEVAPDVLYVNDLPLSVLVCRVAERRSLPVVVDYHHEGWPEMARALSGIRGPSAPWWLRREDVFRIWEEVEGECFAGATRILIVDEALVPVFSSRGCVQDKMVVVRNTPRPGDLPRPNGRRALAPLSFDLGYIGSFDIMKDIPGLIRAFAGVPARVASRLLLVGAGEQEPHARSLISDLRMQERIVFFGWQPKERFGELIEACRVCLIPLRVNAFTHQTSPNKIFEYMYFSRPILATPVRHVSGILNETATGLTCPLDQGRLSDGIEILSDPKAARFGANGIECVQEDYRWEDDGRRLRSAFEGLC